MEDLYLLPNRYLVRPSEQNPRILLGFAISEAGSSAGSGQFTLDYSVPFITFHVEQPIFWAYDTSTSSMVEVISVNATHRTNPSAGGIIALPPLAASVILRPAKSSVVIPISQLVYPLSDYHVPVARPLNPDLSGSSFQERASRTLFLRFTAAPIGRDYLHQFLTRRLRVVGVQGFIEAIEYHHLGRNAKFVFSHTAAVEAIVNVELSREVLIHLDRKMAWGYSYSIWLATANHRRAFLTFTEGEPITEAELYGFFNELCPFLDYIKFQRVPPHKQPLHAHLFFNATLPVQVLLQHFQTFHINNKMVRARPYLPSGQR